MGSSASKVKPVEKRAHLTQVWDPRTLEKQEDILLSYDLSAKSITHITEQWGSVRVRSLSYPEGTHEVKGLTLAGIPEFPRYLLRGQDAIVLMITCESNPVIIEHTRRPTPEELRQKELTFSLPTSNTPFKQVHIHSDGTAGFQETNVFV